MACLFVFAAVTLAIAVGMAFEAYTELFHHHGHTFLRLLGVIQWAGGSFGIGAIGVLAWQFALISGFHQVRLEIDGVHFRLGTRKKPCEASFAWSQIAAVIHQTRPDNEYIFVFGKDGKEVNYTAYGIFGYRKLACQIASRAGLQLAELKPIKPRFGKRAAPTN